MKYCTGLLLLLLLGGCIKDEKAVAPHDAGAVVTATADMGEDYRWQIYYRLSTNTIVGRNLKTDWDLGLEAAADGYHVILNAARMTTAVQLSKTDIGQVSWQDTTGFGNGRKTDNAGGSLDSTAIGDWRGQDRVYLLGNNEGAFYKVQFRSVSATAYKLRYGSLKETGIDSIEVSKDSLYNFGFVSLKDHKVVQVEPPKDDWDLVFTGYTHFFVQEQLLYSVTGCLLNRYRTSAVMDSTIDFAQITHNDLTRYTFSTQINTIGYNWKEYSFNSGSYVVFPRMNYIIHDRSGVYFKLHFVDFNRDGIKGNPRWEQQAL